jgi:hypothetical protein
MKISNNPSRQGIRWRWRFFQLVALLTMLSAISFPNRVRELVGVCVVMFVVAYVSKVLEEDLLVEVFDDGDRLRLQQDEVVVSVSLVEIEKASFQDGGDGSDKVTLSLFHPTPWGRYIDFIPEPLYKFEGNARRLFDDLEMRIVDAKASAKAKAEAQAIQDSGNATCESAAFSGESWM